MHKAIEHLLTPDFSINLTAYSIYLEEIQDLMSPPLTKKRQQPKVSRQIVDDGYEDRVINVGIRTIERTRDIIQVFQEIGKNRELYAKNMGLSAAELTRKSHLVVEIEVCVKGTDNLVSRVLFCELAGSENA